MRNFTPVEKVPGTLGQKDEGECENEEETSHCPAMLASAC